MRTLCLFGQVLVLFYFGAEADSFALEEFRNADRSITLSAEAFSPVTEDNRKIRFVMTNSGKSAVEYECGRAPNGLDFQLLDESGSQLPMDEEWFRFNSPRNLNIISTRSCRLAPGDKFEYVLDLNEAFGPDTKSAIHINIDWLATGTPFAPPLISATCYLGKIFPTSGTAPQIELSPTISVKQALFPMWWLAISILIAAGIGVRWTWIKSR